MDAFLRTKKRFSRSSPSRRRSSLRRFLVPRSPRDLLYAYEFRISRLFLLIPPTKRVECINRLVHLFNAYAKWPSSLQARRGSPDPLQDPPRLLAFHRQHPFCLFGIISLGQASRPPAALQIRIASIFNEGIRCLEFL